MARPVPALILASLHSEPLAPGELLDAWHRRVERALGAAPAATSLFIGRTRGVTVAGLPLDCLELEHYPGMTEAELARLAAESARRHGVWAVGVGHRVGPVAPGEAIVVVAVLADRRGPAQRCCQEVLEALKHEAPFWKREWSGGQGTWVEGNTPLEAPDS
jgi:molybdopterin synthase catalytic subunit